MQKIDSETKITDIENKILSTTNLLVMIRKLKRRKTKFQMLMTWYKRQVAAEIKLNDHIFYIKPTNDRSREAFR